MNIWEWLTVFGFTATILGAFLTVYGMINNRTLKAEAKGIRDILDKIEDGQIKAFSKMDDTHRKMDNTLSKIDDTQRYIIGVIKETQRLIVAEGEKTREAIRV
jgi:hypothetical protein